MAAAAAVAAAITIPAGAQDGSGQDPALARFTACLGAHGVDVPSGLDGLAFKQWLGGQQDRPAVTAALAACDSSGPGKGGADGFTQLYSCLTSHGVTVERSPDAVKRRVLQLNESDAGRETLAACKISVGDPAKAGDGRAGKPADAARPEVCGAKS